MLEINAVTKHFGSHTALDKVSLAVAAGEIHGLVGLNGSGKTTLLNILFGSPAISASGGFQGSLLLDGVPLNPTRPNQAMAAGVGMIHQEFALLDSMSVAENVFIGREPMLGFSRNLFGHRLRSGLGLVDRGAMRQGAIKALTRLGLNLDPDLKPPSLSVNLRQFVEIARETTKDGLKLLLLDEPTAVLNHADAAILLDVVRRIASTGTAVLFVSHRLEEVTSVCRRITVLRDGRVSGRFEHGTAPATLALAMVGGEVVKTRRHPVIDPDNVGNIMLSLREFSVDLPGEILHGVNLDVRRGEILGLAGFSGHGKMALAPGVMGLCPSQGSVHLKGGPVLKPHPVTMIGHGLYYMPEDRRAMGLLLDHSVMENMVLPAAWSTGRFLYPLPLRCLRPLHVSRGETYAKERVREFQIKCRSVRQRVDELSGGNQQKVVMAQALAVRPDLLFVSEPTRGVDIQAKERILELLIGINQTHGTTIVMASSELEELRRVCDRIAVVHGGRIESILPPERCERDFALAFSGELEEQEATPA